VSRDRLNMHRRAQACCTVSSWAADSLVQDHGFSRGKVHVIGCGPNVELEPCAGRDWSSPRFLFVGNDWKRKNGDSVVRAFSVVRRELPEARLDLVGSHPRLDEPGVACHGRLSFDDRLERPRLERLFNEATSFVMPSALEPFGIVYVEAASAGVPSIATTVGGTRDSVGEGGVLVDPGDLSAIVGAMRTLSDPLTARKLGERAYRHSRELSWRKSAERLVRAVAPETATLMGFADFL